MDEINSSIDRIKFKKWDNKSWSFFKLDQNNIKVVKIFLAYFKCYLNIHIPI